MNESHWEQRREKAGSRIDQPNQSIATENTGQVGNMKTMDFVAKGKNGEIVESCISGFKISFGPQVPVFPISFPAWPEVESDVCPMYLTCNAEFRHLSINHEMKNGPWTSQTKLNVDLSKQW